MVSLGHITEKTHVMGLPKRRSSLFMGMLVALAVILIALPTECRSDSLDWSGFATAGLEVWLTRMEGRIGFEREPGATGTLNDFTEDLGLPAGNTTFRLLIGARPLEHHLVRLYGSVPEFYRAEKGLERQLRTKNNIYNPGTVVRSESRYGMYGFGYDLDFLVGPRWFGGLNGDIRYLDYRVRLSAPGTGNEDTATLSEVTPCVGAHVQGRLPVIDQRFPSLGLGIFGRMTYGMTPNFINYNDITVGVSFTLAPWGYVALDLKAGYALESLSEQNVNGRDLEFERAGLMFSVQAAF